MRLKSILIVFTTLLVACHSYKILSLFSFSAKSHINGFIPIASELASRGHEVTLVHAHPKLDVPSPIKTLFLEDIAQVEPLNAMGMRGTNTISFMFMFRKAIQNNCERVLGASGIQKLIKAGMQYDIVIINTIMGECSLAIAPLLGKYLILFSSGPLPPFLPNPAPHPPSTVPNSMLYMPSRMNFQQRFKNFLATIAVESWYSYGIVPAATSVVQTMVPQAPTVSEAWKKLSLYMVNQDIVTSSPRPTVPNMVQVAGVNCRAAKPLPKDLEDFMQSSGNDGVIVFSLGSVAQSTHMSQEAKQAFLDAFAKLKQKVLWKFEDDTLKAPPNVKLVKWMPQQDVLGHPKTKLLITHGGVQSIQEAVYHSVPLIGIPLYGDQPGNVARMEELGLGLPLDYDTLTPDAIYDAVNSILIDKGYKDRMKKYSAIFKDVLQPPVKKGAFWIEYVARHNGARHLRTLGEDMCFIQYFLIDVIAFVTFVPLVTLYVLYRVVKFGCGKLCGRKQKQKKDTKKTQ